MKTLNVIVKRVGREPVFESVEDSLSGYYGITGDPIEVVAVTNDGLLMILNEEGKLVHKSLPFNFTIPLSVGVIPGDYAAGDVFFVRDNEDGDFTSVNADDMEKVLAIVRNDVARLAAFSR